MHVPMKTIELKEQVTNARIVKQEPKFKRRLRLNRRTIKGYSLSCENWDPCLSKN